MNFLFKRDKLAESITTLNKLLSSNTFLIEICNISNNNPNIVYQNIERIINYYINNPTTNMLTIREILSSESHKNNDYYYIPTNEYGIDNINSLGFNNNRIPLLRELKNIYEEYNIDSEPKEETSIKEDLNDAIIESFSYPSFIYKNLTDNISPPLKIGETINSYYEQLYLSKFHEIKSLNEPKEIVKILSYYLSKKPVVAIVHKKGLEPGTKKERFHVNKKYYIKLPQQYDIIITCARNLNLPEKTLINLDASRYNRITTIEPELTYSRFEKMNIDSNFQYFNETLTGNPFRDINIIYGSEDVHKSEDILHQPFDTNLSSIQQNSDILLTEQNGKYEIVNGRHRIVYLKYYYESNKNFNNEISSTKISIPAYVTHTYGTKEFTDILRELLKNIPNLKIYKVDNYSNDSRIIIGIDDNYYLINDYNELQVFYNNYQNDLLNKPFIINNPNSYAQTNEVLVSLYNKIGMEIFNMNFINIIEYLRNNPYSDTNGTITIENINIGRLLISFKNLQDYYGKSIVYKEQEINIDNAFVDLIKFTKLSKKILIILQDHPEFIYLNSKDLILELRKYDSFKSLTENEIKRAIEGSNISLYSLNSNDKIEKGTTKHDMF